MMLLFASAFVPPSRIPELRKPSNRHQLGVGMVCTLIMTTLLVGCQSSVSRQQLERSPVQVIGATPNYDPLPGAIAPVSQADSSHHANAGLFDINAPWIEILQPVYQQARRLVEQELGVELGHIQLLLVNDKPINEEVSRETKRLVNEQFGTSAFSEQFLHKVMKNQAGTYAALFTSRLKAIMVSREILSGYENSLPRDPQTRKAALMTLLIHELVHAADDQRYNIHENRALNFRASFAQSATFEGHAQWVTRRICEQSGCTSGLNALDNFMFSRESKPNQFTQPVEAISRNVLEYSYIEGERFISRLAERPDGKQLIDTLLSAPPYDPIQILDPDTFPNHDREALNQRLIKASLKIDHPWVEGRWIGVETSPLKGVNLRADPSRRQAAVDGFTRLIQSMVAMQLYNRGAPDANPLEVTLMHAESAHTARLFARTLHENSQISESTISSEPLSISTGAGNQKSRMQMHVYRSRLDNDSDYQTTVAVSGPYVVQIAGVMPAESTPAATPTAATTLSASAGHGLMDDYAIRVLLNLHLNRI